MKRLYFRGLVPTLVLLSLLISANPTLASDAYLADSKLDPLTLLAPPPLPDSAEQASDLAAVAKAVHERNDTDTAAAHKEESFNAFSFAAVIGTNFDRAHLPQTVALFAKVRKAASMEIGKGKDFWKRPRPYTFDQSLLDGKPEPSFSYPSGHSTGATVDALILADLFPAHRDDIMAMSRNIGWHRVIIGKHFPTDIYAGRVLAQAIVRELKADPNFQQDFAAAQAEIAAASN